MSHTPAKAGVNMDYHSTNRNQDLVLKLFNAYYRAHHHSGELFFECLIYVMGRKSVA